MRKMKDSGVEWIGEIPEEWEVTKVRYLFKIGRGRVIAQTELSEAGIYPVYSSQTKNNGCLGCINTYDFNIDQLTWTTDGANAGTVFLRNGKHNCTNVCGTLQPLDKNLDLRYQKYALEHISFYHKRADTNGYKIMNNEMAEICTIYPPPLIQHGIADFLDRKCAQIDAIIAGQQEIIEKLKLYKQSVITEAVTKGLDPDVPMKDSGIEWIGEIPECWSRTKLNNFLLMVTDGKHGDCMDEENSGYFFVSAKDIINGKIDYSEARQITFTDFQEVHRRTKLQVGDLLIPNTGASIGRIAESTDAERSSKTTFQKSVSVLKIDEHKISKRYVKYVLVPALYEYSLTHYGSAMQNLLLSEIKRFIVPFPSISEQMQIVDYLNDTCTKIDSFIEKKQTLIDKLTQYKKSLIYEAVTGKLEV